MEDVQLEGRRVGWRGGQGLSEEGRERGLTPWLSSPGTEFNSHLHKQPLMAAPSNTCSFIPPHSAVGGQTLLTDKFP